MGRARSRLVGVCLATALAAAGCHRAGAVAAGAGPLPSWNEGPAKQALLDLVKVTTDRGRAGFVPIEDRIATFDQDGTLWVEHPLYAQGMFALDRVRALAPQHPDWKTTEPFKSVLAGDMQAIAKFPESDWEKIIAVTHAGMTTEAFVDDVQRWLATARHPRFRRPYTELIYQPMLEAMRFLRANGFKTYIVTGGGQEFVRAYAARVYGVPPEQVIGSSLLTKFETRDGKPALLREPKVFLIDDKGGKPVAINLFIGKRPIAAFGNSSGDAEMLQWTGASGRRCAADDAGPARRRASRIRLRSGQWPAGHQGRHLPAGAPWTRRRSSGWLVVSMKNDWKRIFAFEELAMTDPQKSVPSTRQ